MLRFITNHHMAWFLDRLSFLNSQSVLGNASSSISDRRRPWSASLDRDNMSTAHVVIQDMMRVKSQINHIDAENLGRP